MFGKLLNLVTMPVRVVVAPVKLTIDLINNEKTMPAITDSLSFIVTAKDEIGTFENALDFNTEKQ